MHRSLEAARRFFKFQQSASLLPSFQVDFTDLIAKKSNCKGTIDRKDNAEVTVSGFFSKRKVFRLSRRELFTLFFLHDLGRAVYAVGNVAPFRCSSIPEFATEDTPITLQRGNREVDCPRPRTRSTKGGNQTRNQPITLLHSHHEYWEYGIALEWRAITVESWLEVS